MLGFMLTLLVVQVGQEVDGVRPCISLLFQHDFRFQSEREQTRVSGTLYPRVGLSLPVRLQADTQQNRRGPQAPTTENGIRGIHPRRMKSREE